MERSFSSIDGMRFQGILLVYSRLKRNKALQPAFSDNLFSLVIDGHESRPVICAVVINAYKGK